MTTNRLDPAIANPASVDGDPLLRAVAQYRHVLGAELQQGAQGRARSPLGTSLEVLVYR